MGERAIDLSGYRLGDEERYGGGEGMLRFPAGSAAQPGEPFVVAQTARGFRALFGRDPQFEIKDSDTAVPDMLVDSLWAGGQFALANDGDEILLIDEKRNKIDALNYGDRTTLFSPAIPTVAAGQSIARAPAVCDTDTAADWHPRAQPAPGSLDLEGDCRTPARGGFQEKAHLTRIGDIQGRSATSPMLNQIVRFRAVVTGTMADRNAAGIVFHTLFVQDPPGFEDGDPQTSDAIALFLGVQPPKFAAGDELLVQGQVTEYYGLTEIDDSGLSIQLEKRAGALPAGGLLQIPQDAAAALDYLEAHESMLVRTQGSLPVVGPTHAGCGFALASQPGSLRPARHSSSDDVIPALLVLHHSDADCSALPALKTGDLVGGVAGPLSYHFEQYKVVQQATEALQVEVAPLPPPFVAAAPAENQYRLVTINLNNYLTPASGPQAELSGRAPAAEMALRTGKLAHLIARTLGCPELIGVQEVDSRAMLAELVAAAAGPCGFPYEISHLESADGRGIDVALLSHPRRVDIEGLESRQACSTLSTGVVDVATHCPAGEEPLFSRAPLEVALRIDGERAIILVNHFKSKRGGETATAARRLRQAEVVHDLVAQRLAADPAAAIFVLGDFNDYDQSAVWRQLQEGGVLFDAAQRIDEPQRYTYIFDGMTQLIDGILVSPELVPRIASVSIAHVNADYPVSLALDDSPSGLPYQASDHDPLMLTMNAPSYSIAAAAALPAADTATVIPNEENWAPTKQTAAGDARPPAPPERPQRPAGVASDWSSLLLLVFGTLGVAVIVLRWKKSR